MEIRQRLSHRMEALRQKRKTGSLTPEEEKQLHRLEALSQGFQPPLKKETQDGTPQKKAEPGAPALHTTPASPQ